MRFIPKLIPIALAAVLLAPATAHADGFITGNLGVNFGADTPEKNTTFGGGVGFIGEAAGIELETTYSPDFFNFDDDDVSGNVVTVMGTLLIGGRRGGFSPYLAVGAGLIRTQVEVISDVFEDTKNSFGANVGGGVFIGSGPVAFRGDIRYYRAFDTSDDFDLLDDKFSFWRGSGGITFFF